QAQHGVLGVAVLGVPVTGQADGAGAVALHDRLHFLGALVGQAGTVVVGDVPVQLDQVALVGEVHAAAAGHGAGLEAQVPGRVDDLLQVDRRHLVGSGRTVAEAGVQPVGG